MENSMDRIEPDTEWLMYSLLTDMGCSPETDENGTMMVKYQGQTFLMQFKDSYVHIWLPKWALTKAGSPEEPMVRKAINRANSQAKATIVLSDPDSEGYMGLFAHREILLHPACPDNSQYIENVLESFFEAKECVRASHYYLKMVEEFNRDVRNN